jgi:hypothetical protein
MDWEKSSFRVWILGSATPPLNLIGITAAIKIHGSGRKLVTAFQEGLRKHTIARGPLLIRLRVQGYAKQNNGDQNGSEGPPHSAAEYSTTLAESTLHSLRWDNDYSHGVSKISLCPPPGRLQVERLAIRTITDAGRTCAGFNSCIAPCDPRWINEGQRISHEALCFHDNGCLERMLNRENAAYLNQEKLNPRQKFQRSHAAKDAAR